MKRVCDILKSLRFAFATMVGCCVLLLPSLAFADTYAITYEMNGGTNYSDAPSNYETGTGVIINGYPTKTDYTFAGWCMDAELTTCSASQTIAANAIGPEEFWAKWSCAGGYYLSNNSCVTVGRGYWSGANSDTRSQCSNGLTTIGFGAGADESGDYGRILHVGDYALYLRTTRGTDRTLNVQIGNDLYYGNMSTTNMNISYGVEHQFKLTVGETTYSVYDDSASPYIGN